MAKYRNKIIVEAMLFQLGMEDGFSCQPSKIAVTCQQNGPTPLCMANCNKLEPFIQTINGPELVHEGDYVVVTSDGFKIVCPPEIFEAAYEEVIEVN